MIPVQKGLPSVAKALVLDLLFLRYCHQPLLPTITGTIPITPNAGLIIALTWKLFFHKNLHGFGLLKVFTLLMTMIPCPVGLTAWWDTVLFILRQWLWQWEHVDSGVRTFKLNFDHLFTGYMILEQLNNLFIDHLHLLIRKKWVYK